MRKFASARYLVLAMAVPLFAKTTAVSQDLGAT
jgi:hypothetical protein